VTTQLPPVPGEALPDTEQSDTDFSGTEQSGTTPAAADDRTSAAGTRPVPYLLLAAVAVVLVTLRAAYGPIRDIDLYWHFLVGRDILAGIPVSEAGRGWSFAPVPDTWVSTQWLAEVLFARMEQWGGIGAIVWYRTLTTIAALVVLAAVTLWRRPVRAGAWVYAFAAFGLSTTVEDRSQQLTFILAPLVGWWAERLYREGRLPRWWIVLPLVVVWSNFHGGWVILPMVLALAALARLVDHGWRDQSARKALLLAAGAMAAACVSPSGIDNALAARRFSSSTGLIIEWQPVAIWDWTSLPLVGLLTIAVVCWARGRVRPKRGEIVLVLGIATFAIIAWRNLAPATLMLAPIVTGTLARALGEADPAPRGERPRLLGPSLALAALGIVGSLVVASMQNPVVDPILPTQLIATIRSVPSPQRVLNTYNLAGPVLWFGGPPPHVTVGIDGRSDRYGHDYTSLYQDGLIQARPGWETLFDQLHPTCALLWNRDALSSVLVAERHWVEVGRQGEFVLLRAPDATGWPAKA
jgi:hypothetical protein